MGEKRILTLELGCGNKRVSQHSIGLDIRRDSKADIIADAHHLPFINNIFEETVMFQVLEHLHSPYEALKEVRRVSNSLLLSIPNRYHYRSILRWTFTGQLAVANEHIYAWTSPEIRNLLKVCGFHIKTIQFTTTHYQKQSRLYKILKRMFEHSLIVKACRSIQK